MLFAIHVREGAPYGRSFHDAKIRKSRGKVWCADHRDPVSAGFLRLAFGTATAKLKNYKQTGSFASLLKQMKSFSKLMGTSKARIW